MKNKFTQKAAALLCSKKALNRARTAHRLLSMTAIIACLAVVPAFADNEALNAVNKLSDTIFALIKAGACFSSVCRCSRTMLRSARRAFSVFSVVC